VARGEVKEGNDDGGLGPKDMRLTRGDGRRMFVAPSAGGRAIVGEIPRRELASWSKPSAVGNSDCPASEGVRERARREESAVEESEGSARRGSRMTAIKPIAEVHCAMWPAAAAQRTRVSSACTPSPLLLGDVLLLFLFKACAGAEGYEG
jgi:hypothetical protein